MLKLLLNDKSYIVEWRHIKKGGKRAQLHRGHVKAVSTCVIVCQNIAQESPDGAITKINFIAIDNALCSDLDNFSRREGRKLSLRKVLKHCGALKDVRVEIWEHWRKKDPAPARILRDPDGDYYKVVEHIDIDVRHYVDPPVKTKPTPELIEAYRQAGEAKRQARKARA